MWRSRYLWIAGGLLVLAQLVMRGGPEALPPELVETAATQPQLPPSPISLKVLFTGRTFVITNDGDDVWQEASFHVNPGAGDGYSVRIGTVLPREVVTLRTSQFSTTTGEVFSPGEMPVRFQVRAVVNGTRTMNAVTLER